MGRVALALAIIVATTGAVMARDDGRYAGSPYKSWFDSLKSGRGPCCADADGNVVKDADWGSVNDPARPHVHDRVRIENQWVDVPDDAVITVPNLFGRTVVWPTYHSMDGGPLEIDIRCFIAGAQG